MKFKKKVSRYTQRGLRNGEVNKCKQDALNDMEQDERKYIRQEYLIMKLKQYDYIYISI